MRLNNFFNKEKHGYDDIFGFGEPCSARYGGGPSIPPGMSAEDRAMLLEKEAELADERDAKQREFLNAQEAQRLAREESQRLLVQQEEASRIAELERLELEGAEVAETLTEPEDKDTQVADMFAALAFGTEAVGSKVLTSGKQITPTTNQEASPTPTTQRPK